MDVKVGLLIIATNKYQKFIQPLIDSANKYFLNQDNIDVEYFVFTDTFYNVENTKRRVNIILTEHNPGHG